MTDGDLRAWHQPPHARRGGLDRLDPVVDIKDLPAAIQLAVDRVAHQPVIVLGDAGLDREPSLGRRLDDREVADPHQRQVQRAGDGRRGERQHVHLSAHVLDALLVADPKSLLLVDHQQAKVGEVHVLAQDPMRPDQDVDRPIRNAFDDLLLATGLLPAQLEDALSELAALGAVSSDGFATMRMLVTPHLRRKAASRNGRRQTPQKSYQRGGRWSRFPPVGVQALACGERTGDEQAKARTPTFHRADPEIVAHHKFFALLASVSRIT